MPRSKREVKAVEVAEPDVDVHTLLSRLFSPRRAPENSILASLLDVTSNPAMLIYGPSKTGKTRLAVWEGAALATALESGLEVLVTEANAEVSDIADMIGACALQGVPCSIVKFDSLEAVDHYVTSRLRGVLRERDSAPRVFVLDSLTALSDMVTLSVSADLASNPPALIGKQNPAQSRISDPLRRLVSFTGVSGYLLMVAHETKTLGSNYKPGVHYVNAKPRYVSAGKYREDAEIYFTNEQISAFSCKEARTKSNWRSLRALIVVEARRDADAVGRGVVFSFTPVSDKARGTIIYERGDDYSKFTYDPTASKTLQVKTLKPVIVCEPQKIT